MIERMVKASSNENELVLDCFLGSGTTALACQNLGCNFIGCEGDITHYNHSLKSLNENSPQ